MIIKDTKHKRILQMTNFGINIWPKTVTEAVLDNIRNKSLSSIIDELYDRPQGDGRWGTIEGNIMEQGDLLNLIDSRASSNLSMVDRVPSPMQDETLYIEYANNEQVYADGFYEAGIDYVVHTTPLPVGPETFRLPDNIEGALGAVKVPYGVKEIEVEAFKDSNVYSITLPPTLTTFGKGALANTPNLYYIMFTSETPPIVEDPGDNVGLTYGVTVYVPFGTIDAYKAAYNWPAAEKFTFSEYSLLPEHTRENRVFYNGNRLFFDNIILRIVVSDVRTSQPIYIGHDIEGCDLIEIEIITPTLSTLYGATLSFEFDDKDTFKYYSYLRETLYDNPEAGLQRLMFRYSLRIQGELLLASVWYMTHGNFNNSISCKCEIDNFAWCTKNIRIKTQATGTINPDDEEYVFGELSESIMLRTYNDVKTRIISATLTMNGGIIPGTIITVRKR